VATPNPHRAYSSYDEYETALTAILKIPAQLNSGLVAADQAAARAKQAADEAFQQFEARLAGLRRTANSRYSTTVDALKVHHVLLPAQVRPEGSSSGDENAVRNAVETHTRAIAAVDVAIKTAAHAAEQEKNDAATRVQAAQQAALALKLRQDRIRQQQREAVARDAESQSQAEAAAQRRKRTLIISSVAAAALFVAVMVLLLTQ